VSLLTVASKICERAALNQLMEYMSQERVSHRTSEWKQKDAFNTERHLMYLFRI
jgi:hypothetical protein